MTGLTPELLAKYRPLVAHIAFSDEAKDEAIRIIHRIMQVGVAIGWGADSTQIALNQQFSKASLGQSSCDSLTHSDDIVTVDPACGGANNKTEPEEYAP